MNVSLTLVDIVAISESKNRFELKLMAVFSWFEERATYYNLKQDEMLNTLTLEDMKRIWIPSIIYSNTNSNENIKESISLSSATVIRRQRNFQFSNIASLDETQIFSGDKNMMKLRQDYTKVFRCYFKLQTYPFDIQVLKNIVFLIFFETLKW